MEEKGQVSLEYLLVMLSFLALLGLALPLIEQAKENANFVLSFKQGQGFAWRLKTEAEKLQLFSHGSQEELSISSPTPWHLKLEDNQIRLSIQSGEKEMWIELECGAGFEEFDEGWEQGATLQLENIHGEIIVSLK